MSSVWIKADGEVNVRTIFVPGWIGSDQEHARWIAANPISATAEALVAVGWFFSFGQRIIAEVDLRTWPFADLAFAAVCFRAAAEMGDLTAFNNLGVMLRDGLGVTQDLDAAFDCFRRAAECLDPQVLRNLARAYRRGEGCDVDEEEADFLEELADVRQEELREAAKKTQSD